MTDTLSVIIPAYNEQSCIVSTLQKVVAFARAYPACAEVIVVDDGSDDGTPESVLRFIQSLPADDPRLHLVRHKHNRGKGASVRSGFAVGNGEILLFTDADLSAPIEESRRLIDAITARRCEIAIGSRAVDPSTIRVQQSAFRRAGGRVFNFMTRAITGLAIRDTQCGFKAFRREACASVFSLQRLEGFAFDVELLYLASRQGLRVCELPVDWSHVGDSKVSLMTDAVRMLLDLCRIRLNDWRGLYKIPKDVR